MGQQRRQDPGHAEGEEPNQFTHALPRKVPLSAPSVFIMSEPMFKLTSTRIHLNVALSRVIPGADTL